MEIPLVDDQRNKASFNLFKPDLFSDNDEIVQITETIFSPTKLFVTRKYVIRSKKGQTDGLEAQ